MRRLFRARLLLLGLVIGTGWSCTETLVGIVDIANIEIEPTTATVFVDEDVTLEARLKDDRGNTLSGRDVTWSSGNPQVASVNDAGLVHAVSAGTADIVVTSEGTRSTARITVMNRPVIHADPDSVVFSYIAGAIPVPLVVEVTNDGDSTLSDLTVAVDYEGGPAGWLDVELSATDAPAALTVTPLIDSLDPNNYTATIHISAPEASNTPLSLRVRLELLQPKPVHLLIAGGDEQSALAGSAVSTAIGVLVTDGNGNPIADVAVHYEIVSGGGSLASSAPVLTDGNGIALAPVWTLGTSAGPNTLKATVEELPGDAVMFTAMATPGAQIQLAITTEPSASAPTGSSFARQPAVQLRDALDNDVPEAGVSITAGIVSGGGTLAGTVTVTTDVAGVAQFTDLAITGSVGERTLEFTSAGLTAATSAAISVTTGAGTRLSLAQQPSAAAPSGVTFADQPAVQLEDAGANHVAQAGVLVTAAILSGSGTLAGTTTATTDASGVAAFNDLRITGTVGDRILQFSASGIAAVDSDQITITVGPAAPAHSSAVVPAGIAGVATSIAIDLRDDGDNPVSGAAAALAVSVSGANTAAPTVTETGSGGYSARYTPMATGTDRIAITVGGAPIAGSPFTSVVTPSGVSDATSSVSATPTSVVADGQDAAEITVVLRDSIGNPVIGLAGSIQVGLAGTASAGSIAETSTPGTYMFNLTSTVANLVGIAVTVGGTTLSESPTVAFTTGPIAVVTSAASASPARGVPADGMAPSTVTIVLADAFNNPIRGLNDADFLVNLTGSALATVVTESLTPGTYTFDVTNNVAETVTVSVTVTGIALTQQPTIQFVAGGVNASNSTAAANPTTGVIADGADASTVTVTLFDDNGNVISGLLHADFTITPTGSAQDGTVSEVVGTPGTYMFAVTNTVAEAVTLTIAAAGVQLTATPGITFVPGPVSGSVSSAAANPTSGVVADNVDASTITVVVVDANSNPITGLVDSDFNIVVPAGVTKSLVTGGSGGTYTFTVTSTAAGSQTISISAAGVALNDQPTIDFAAGAVSGSLSGAVANPATGVTADGTTASTVTVTVVDANSNPVRGLGVTDFIVTDDGSASIVFANETTPGTYTFTATNTTAEKVTVTIVAVGVTLTTKPTIEFVAGGVSPGSTVSPSRTLGVTADNVDASVVTLTLVDAGGNAVTGLQAADFMIDVGANAGFTAVTETATLGTYTFSVTNTVAETVTVIVTAAGTGLTSTPTIEFVAGPVSPANSSVTTPPTPVVAG